MNCNYCGQAPARIINTNGTGACDRCAQLFGTCHLCLNSVRPCEFETNPSPIPKQIQKTVRQGNVQMQTIIDNPERIEAFCHKCPCWCDACGRYDGTCGSYNEYTPSPTPDEETSSDVNS